MEISTVGSVNAFVRSLKTSGAACETMQNGYVRGYAKDTAAFSAKAHAAAKAARNDKSERASDNVTAEELKERLSALAEKAERDKVRNDANKTGDNAADKTASAENSSAETDKKDEGKSISELIKEQMEKIDNMFSQGDYDKSKDNRLGSIKAKMRSGLTLSPSEQQYLAAKDPDAYSVFQTTESARISYRYSLNACRTKDDVTAMRLSNALSALSAYKKAIRNGGDGAAVAGLNAALDREIRSFTSSANYRRLPTVAECNKFDRDLAKAKRNEREKKLAEKRKQEAKRKRTLAARREAAKKARYKKTPGDGKMTVAQVMSSPTARKVLASRSKSGSVGFAYVSDYKSTGKLYSKA